MPARRIFITGISGLFGLNAALVLGDKGYEVWGCYLTHPVEIPGGRALELDLTNEKKVSDAFSKIQPEVVIHAAALTNVDACEVDRDAAQLMNVTVTEYVAHAAHRVGARLVYLSTDQVFDGTTKFATEATGRSPINVYGRTKMKGEDVAAHAHPDSLVIRTNFFGWGPPYKLSLSDWILARLRAGEEVPGFTDVYFTPILVNELIARIEALVSYRVGGLLHVAGKDRVSKYDFARLLAERFGENPEQVRPMRVAEAGLRAPRPLDMSLDGSEVEKELKKNVRDRSLDGSRADELIGWHRAELQFGLAELKGLENEYRRWPERIRMLAQPRQVSA